MNLNILMGLIFIYGACIGSFLNVVVWRLPRGEKLTGRSHCPSCKHKLSWYDLLPFVSYILLNGKCRYCQKKISVRYPLAEFIIGVLFVLMFVLVTPGTWADWLFLVRLLAAVCFLFVIFIIDLEHFLILDKVVFPGVIFFFLLNIVFDLIKDQSLLSFHSGWFLGLVGMFAALPFYLIWYFSKGRMMGFGDVKLAIFLGVLIGWPLVWLNLLLAIWIGGVFGVVVLTLKMGNLKSKLPFGTFLTFAALITLIWGQGLWNWYLAFLGI